MILLFLSLFLFLIGFSGLFVIRKNLIVLLMCIELMLLALNLGFIYVSMYYNDLFGQLFALLVLTVAAGESAIGLAILVVFYRLRNIIDINFINLLKA